MPYMMINFTLSLQWRYNGHDSVLNHQPHHCLLNGLFRRISKKTSKLRVTGLCVGNSPGTGEFPAQMASNAENVSIWWRHLVLTGPHSTIPLMRRISCHGVCITLNNTCIAEWRSASTSISVMFTKIAWRWNPVRYLILCSLANMAVVSNV